MISRGGASVLWDLSGPLACWVAFFSGGENASGDPEQSGSRVLCGTRAGSQTTVNSTGFSELWMGIQWVGGISWLSGWLLHLFCNDTPVYQHHTLSSALNSLAHPLTSPETPRAPSWRHTVQNSPSWPLLTHCAVVLGTLVLCVTHLHISLTMHPLNSSSSLSTALNVQSLCLWPPPCR